MLVRLPVRIHRIFPDSEANLPPPFMQVADVQEINAARIQP
jgi:hypothetical protein